MTESTEVTTRPTTEAQPQPPGRETLLTPPVDISERSDGILLIADMPGVTKESLSIQVDQDTLMIEGTARLDMPEGIRALYAEVRSTRYRRAFGLSSELDWDAIDAQLSNGVLTLRIPKRAELRPRKIEIRSE